MFSKFKLISGPFTKVIDLSSSLSSLFVSSAMIPAFFLTRSRSSGFLRIPLANPPMFESGILISWAI